LTSLRSTPSSSPQTSGRGNIQADPFLSPGGARVSPS
jgi:hypothetical protein